MTLQEPPVRTQFDVGRFVHYEDPALDIEDDEPDGLEEATAAVLAAIAARVEANPRPIRTGYTALRDSIPAEAEDDLDAMPEYSLEGTASTDFPPSGRGLETERGPQSTASDSESPRSESSRKARRSRTSSAGRSARDDSRPARSSGSDSSGPASASRPTRQGPREKSREAPKDQPRRSPRKQTAAEDLSSAEIHSDGPDGEAVVPDGRTPGKSRRRRRRRSGSGGGSGNADAPSSRASGAAASETPAAPAASRSARPADMQLDGPDSSTEGAGSEDAVSGGRSRRRGRRRGRRRSGSAGQGPANADGADHRDTAEA